jgi:hypothetical protein
MCRASKKKSRPWRGGGGGAALLGFCFCFSARAQFTPTWQGLGLRQFRFFVFLGTPHTHHHLASHFLFWNSISSTHARHTASHNREVGGGGRVSRPQRKKPKENGTFLCSFFL